MKLLTSANNPAALKIQIAANISGVSLEVKQVKTDDLGVPLKRRLPILEVTSDVRLFSPNAACQYLLECGGKYVDNLEIDEWLEWENSQLQPVLIPYLQGACTKKTDQALQSTVVMLLETLNLALEGKKNLFLVEASLSTADVAVWSSLYPIATDSRLNKDCLSKYHLVQQWFNNLCSNSAFSSAVERLDPGTGIEKCKAAILAQVVPQLQSSSVNTSECRSDILKAYRERDFDDTSSFPEHESSHNAEPLTEVEIQEAYITWVKERESVMKPKKWEYPVLPQKGERNVLVTSALPYVNNTPHLGNIIGAVLSADIFARFCRLRNYNTLYICGTDEYGTATENKALEEGLSPREICDKYHKLHSNIYQWFSISFDYFGRTTTQQQTQIAQDIFWRIEKNGYFCEDTMDQLLCEKCNRFLADRFVEGICPFCSYEDARGDQCDACGKLISATELKLPRCKICSTTPVIRTSKHIFLDLPMIEPKLQEWMEKSSPGWTSNAQVIAKSWIKDGLKPRCITRDLKWGTPVPKEGFTDKVFYVWFDAPIGYLSITANYSDEWEKWWKSPDLVTYYEFMAKDNVPFHSVVFPCTLIGTQDGYTMVDHLISTEYLNYEDGKFSKSRGVGVFGDHAQETGIPADIWRFYLLYIRPESQDSAFSWIDLMTKNNSELLNNLGNFINRSLTFVSKSFNGRIPDMILTKEDHCFLAYVSRELKTYINIMEKARLRDAIRHILNISRLGNQYIQSQKPWELVKGSEKERTRAGTVIGVSANVSCLLSVMVQPYMPTVSQTIQSQLSAPMDVNVLTDEFVCYLPQGHKIGKPSPLFQKIELSQVEDLKKQFKGRESSNAPVTPSSDASTTTPAVQRTIAVDLAEVERLTKEVAQQGDIVRQLKANKAEKEKVSEEVEKLKQLKRQLAVAEGKDLNETVSKGKDKKKGKK